jgi:hypothetical protein
MGYTSIDINFNEGTLCDVLGSTMTLSDSRLSRDRTMVVRTVNYTEDESGGLLTNVAGFSSEYSYTRKSPDYDISFFTMTANEQYAYELGGALPDSEVYIMEGDTYGVGGWSMHSIAEKIAVEWMGLSVENNLPDFWISDYTISLGSTFFEALTGLISEFDPLIVLSGGTLYILERSGAGALNSGQVTLSGTPSRSVDREYVPIPGCIKVEGQEGQYICDKDPTCAGWYIGEDATSKSCSGTVKTPDGSSTDYTISEKYSWVNGEVALVQRVFTSRFCSAGGELNAAIITTTDVVYGSNGAVESEVETCEVTDYTYWLNETFSIISNAYEHDSDLNLISQVTSKYEAFLYDEEEFTYVKYDPRDYAAAPDSTLTLINSEMRSAVYTKMDEETYGVGTAIVTTVYDDEEEIWATNYVFEHDVVEAGGQQHRSNSSGATKTLQVYAGDCVFLPDLSVYDEPPRIFSIPTPCWNSIEDCYAYLSALVAYEFQKASAVTPIIDPLPLIAIDGLGSIIESGIQGYNYVRGYTINISVDGYTTNLDMEARRAQS